MNETTNSTNEQAKKAKSFLCDCLSQLDPMRILNRVKVLVLTPKTAWEEIKQEQISIKEIYIQYLIPLMILSCVASFIGMQIFGITIPFLGNYKPPFFTAFFGMLVKIVLGLASVLLGSLIISKISPKFEGAESFEDSFKLLSFAFLPGLLAGVLGIIPSLGILASLVGIYSLYIYFVGVVPMLNVAADKKIVFAIVSIVAIIITMILLSLILSIFAPSAPELSPEQAMEQLNPMLDKFADTIGKAAQQQ